LIRVYVEGVGLAGPGLAGWQRGRSVLAGLEPYTPAPTVIAAPRQLPAAEGRRTGLPVRLALAVATEAFEHAERDAAATATVFTSSSGDGDNVHEILERLATPDRDVSPTRFHNSVHNAAAGYWSIAARSHAPSTSLCAYDASFAAGLLDAATQIAVESKPVALIVYDHPYPEPLHAKRPLAENFAAALVLAPEPGEHAFASVDIEIARDSSNPVTALADSALEALRTGVAAARSLPLLAALAREASTVVDIEYVGGARLTLKVAPCR
jgi:hypothetical protein